ncbi:hypothetical protein D7X12_39600 [Corallococcus sicarius]|uniref:Uncharacterized protein n=1 Tax=Corallococcus sicarius TaxID=2316726 RepID=A0A3A8MPG1_9BACT|nr:hypothetical protein D7X12_39600 [Corallococcus sicarius]
MRHRPERPPAHQRDGALLRGREGAEGPRRAADGAARAMLPAHLLEGPKMAAVWRLERRRRGTS